ncbi:MAG: DUF3472 domain-containing protein [Chitinophagaceae bacterium]|nr:DUF3472 domain-containing protein [Chitinophagaceae bacterium]
MKKYLFVVLCVISFSSANAADKDSTVYYNLPDSIKAVQFMAEINIHDYDQRKNCFIGIKTDAVAISMVNRGGRFIEMTATVPHMNIVRGIGVGFELKYGDPRFGYNWEIDQSYKLLISQATDSAGNFSLYSGYIFLPKENKWKLLGTMKILNRWNSIQRPAFYYYKKGKKELVVNTGEVWIQRSNGSWKNLKKEDIPNPAINWFGHMDSIQQREVDKKIIGDAIISGKIEVKRNPEGIYYTMMKEGTGRQVTVNDTVTAFYKGYLFANDSVFDQTREKPATFPLKRLIRGWQIGVPLCKVGGKIKLVIPSDLAYSIRTRAAKIPPNSILVFEIEVLDAKNGN